MARSPEGLAGLELASWKSGTRLRLRVKAGGRKNALEGVRAGALRLSVTAAPERGRANAAVVKLLADTLGVRATAVEMASGHASPDKTVRISLEPEEVRRRLGRSLGRL